MINELGNFGEQTDENHLVLPCDSRTLPRRESFNPLLQAESQRNSAVIFPFEPEEVEPKIVSSLSIFQDSPSLNFSSSYKTEEIQRPPRGHHKEKPESPKEFLTHNLLKGFIELRELTSYDLLNKKRSPLLQALLRIKFGISELARLIISNSVFEGLILIVIIANTVELALESSSSEQEDYFITLELIFLIVYTVECGLKILGMGFILNNKAYLKDPWNMIDFIIVVSGWVALVFTEGVNLAALRSLRILRPLRSISSIEGLKVLFQALVLSIKALLSSVAVLLFFFLIFAIAGLKLYVGVLKYRCFDVNAGEFTSEVCGEADCSAGEKCVLGLDNPNFGVTNFDNILYSFLVVFQCVTLEGWSDIMIMIEKSFSIYSVFYFVPLVFIGAFLFLNLTLAVIKFNFTEVMNEYRKEEIFTLYTEEKEDKEKIKTELMMSRIQEHLNVPSPLRKERKFYSLMTLNEARENEIDLFSPENLNRNYQLKKDFTDLRMHKIADIVVDFKRPSFHSESEPDANSFEISSEIGLDDSSERFIEEKSEYNIIHSGGENIESSFQNSENINLNKIRNHFTFTELNDLRSSMSISKSLLKKSMTINRNKKLEVKQVISESYIVISDSKNDIIEEDIDDYCEEFKYKNKKFMYFLEENEEKVCDQIQENQLLKKASVAPEELDELLEEEFNEEEKISEVSLFRLLSCRMTNKEAFYHIKGSALRKILDLSKLDFRLKTVIGYYSGPRTFENSNAEEVIKDLNNMEFRIWPEGWFGLYKKLVFPLYIFANSKVFNTIMTCSVITNTLVLSMYHHGISSDMEEVLNCLNLFFTSVFILEMCIKILGLGFTEYCRDLMNYLDAAVVILSIVELIFVTEETSAISAFRTVRIFRSFRVLRVARLFRYLESMAMIIKVIGSSLSKFIYLALLLLLLIIIFALLGMQIFGGRFDFPEGTPRANFDSFHWAFVTVFQILSMENWQEVLFSAMRSTNPACILYFITWIFLGNFILLNLFLAILLDSFNEVALHNRKETISSESRERTLNKLKSRRYELREILDHSRSEDESIDLKNRNLTREFSQLTCKKSFYIFSKQNKLRKLCYKISQSKTFENSIFMLILLSNLKLLADTYLLDEDEGSDFLLASTIFDRIFTFFFTIEFLIKAISLGFKGEQDSYLADHWNKLDLVIVLISLIETVIVTNDLDIIKVFRVLRTLRPLRMISHNNKIKIVVSALLESIIALLNVLVVLVIVWLMFSILGVSLFGGKFYKCENRALETEEDCLKFGYEWVNAKMNFDNVLEALLSLFIVSSLEGWPELMYQAVDSTEVGKGPEKNHSPESAYYFIIFVLLGAFFSMNLFIGVVFEKFEELKKEESHLVAAELNKEIMFWVEMQILLTNSSSNIDISQEPDHELRRVLYSVSKNYYFELLIILCIILNMIQMALLYDGASEKYLQTLEYLNLIFTLIFVLECLIKITGQGFNAYFHQYSNKFDFFVVMCSILDLILSSILVEDSFRFLRTGPQLIRIIRVLRVSRLVRIAKVLKPIQDIVNILANSMPAVISVLSLLFLIYFIYDILGVALFNEITEGMIIDEYTNFKDFGQTMITLLRMSTGEDWQLIMYDCMNEFNELLTALYFISFVSITSFVILNLFTMVIVEVHEEYHNNPESVLKVFNKHTKNFKKTWRKYALQFSGYKMKASKLPELMEELGEENLGVADWEPNHKIVMKLASLDLVITHKFVYYHDLLFALLKDKYFNQKLLKGKFEIKIMEMEEESTKRRLLKLRRKASKAFMNLPRENLFNNSNFFMSQMLMKRIFQHWIEYVNNRKAKREMMSESDDSLQMFTEPLYPSQRPSHRSNKSFLR